jgi:hypothetical protein
MSVELEVRLGAKVVPMSEVLKAIADELEARFSRDEERRLTWNVSEGSLAVLGAGPGVGRLGVSDDAVVEVRTYSVGTDDELAEDGGWWVSFSAVVRSPDTICLMLIAAACLARLVSAQVLDESLLMKQRRWVLPESMLGRIGTSDVLSFSETAATLNDSGKLGSNR